MKETIFIITLVVSAITLLHFSTRDKAQLRRLLSKKEISNHIAKRAIENKPNATDADWAKYELLRQEGERIDNLYSRFFGAN